MTTYLLAKNRFIVHTEYVEIWGERVVQQHPNI